MTDLASKTYKALSLISGGQDCMLATKLILEQGIHVEGINFFTGFVGDHDYCFKRFQKGSHSAKRLCDQLGIKLHVVNIAEEFKSILLNPEHGYGYFANLYNPCIDCHLFMIVQAKKWLDQHGFDFIVSGEILDQRRLSQNKDTLPLAVQATNDLIVRPLSAKLLQPTLPERKGWVKRELFYDFSGRKRKPQFDLAKKFGIKKVPHPGSGCLLTNAYFCRRLKDLWDHRLNRDYSLDDVLLLRIGDHLRINPDLKIIVGRDKVENNFIEKFVDKSILLQAIDHSGPIALLDGNAVNKDDLKLISKLVAYFGKGHIAKKVKISIRSPQTEEHIIEVVPLTKNDVLPEWYI